MGWGSQPRAPPEVCAFGGRPFCLLGVGPQYQAACCGSKKLIGFVLWAMSSTNVCCSFVLQRDNMYVFCGGWESMDFALPLPSAPGDLLRSAAAWVAT